MSSSVVVIMLPCGGGFPHPGLRDAIRREGVRVHDINGTDQRMIIHRLKHLVQVEKERGSTIILHGWSMGGGILLRYLSEIPDGYVRAVVLYAPAGRARVSTNTSVVVYHNTNDRIIPVTQSHTNVDMLGLNARLFVASENYGGNNHQCSEFVDSTMTYLKEIVSENDNNHCNCQDRSEYTLTTDVSSTRFSGQLFEFFRGVCLYDFAFMNFTSYREGSKILFVFKLVQEEPTYRCRPNCPSWDDIECVEDATSALKTNCRDRRGNAFPDSQYHRSRKIFVRNVRNLYEYVKNIQLGTYSRRSHDTLWQSIQDVLMTRPDLTVVNHNIDVDMLHFKFEKF